MTDWKKKIDDVEDARNAERLRRVEEEKEREMKVIQAKYEELSRKFKCHICDKPAQHPDYIEGTYYEDGGKGDGRTDWSRPGDLGWCHKCQKWACDEHIYKGICQKCAEKM